MSCGERWVENTDTNTIGPCSAAFLPHWEKGSFGSAGKEATASTSACGRGMAIPATASPPTPRFGYPLVTGHGQDVAEAPLLQPRPELRVLPVCLVRSDPLGRQAGGDSALNHPQTQRRLRRELDVRGDAGLDAADGVVAPAAGQIQLPVDQRAPGRAGIGEEHPELAVLRPSRRAGVLALHPRPT